MGYRQVRDLIQHTCILTARLAIMAIVISTTLTCFGMDCFGAQPAGEDAGKRTVLFLGNESLPPMNFINKGKPAGVVIDLVKAIAKHMNHPVEIRLMDWNEAQQRVLDGQADALLQINPNPERLKLYDFSQSLLTSEFTIFISSTRHGIATMRDLRRLRVGVEKRGLPVLLLKKDPQIILEIIPNFVQGFGMIKEGALDAVIADRWVGSFVLAENNIHGIKLIEEPLSRSYSAIAVKKGNTDILNEINSGLADIRRDGTYDKIISSWQSEEVIFETRGQLREKIVLIAAISTALLLALVVIAWLVSEIRRRKRTEIALKKNQELLNESREHLQLFIEHAPVALAMFNCDMRYLAVSKRWRFDYGLGERELLGISHYEIFPEIPDRWKKVHRRGLSGEIVRSEEDRFERSDGSIQWLRWEVLPWKTSDGQIGGIVIFTEDVTERKRTGEALKESETKYRNLFMNMAEEVHFWKLVREESGRIKTWRLVDANPPTLKTWGRTSTEEIIGKTTDEIFGTGATEHYMPVVQKIMTEGVPYFFEDYFPNLDKYFRFASVPLGEYFITTGADVTEIKKTQKALYKRTAELEAVNKELETFAFAISHDLRAPLRHIASFLGILAEEYNNKIDEQGRDLINRVQSGAARMTELINALLGLSRISSNQVNRTRVYLTTLAKNAAEMLQKTQPGRNVEIIIADDMVLDGDAVMLQAMVNNLIGNAWKYTERTLSAKIEFGKIQIDGKDTFFVKDNGIGFDMKYADKLFKPFHRLHSDDEFQGIGIGLSIVHSIVSRHGGRIWAEAEVGKGATFYFTLQ